MTEPSFAMHRLATARHHTTWLEAGPADGPLLLFIHGWPELGLVWRAQLTHFAATGWRCVAPDMRGYGGSAVPTAASAYAVRELVADMVELHDALGGAPAVWVGHDWGSPVVWALAAHHADRCRAVANLCVPYFARGFALPNLLPLVDREWYPADQYPAGQLDYFLFYREHFAQAAQDFEADVAATIAVLYRTGSPEALTQPALTAAIRAQGGWFGPAHRAPALPRDQALLSQADYDALVAAFRTTGFRGANAWYLNDAANLAYAAKAPDFGRCRLADPMRADCLDLHEVAITGGHELMLERPAEVNATLGAWLAAKALC